MDAAVAFRMKRARLEVVRCLEHLIELSVSDEVGAPPELWGAFSSDLLQTHPHLFHRHRVCVGLNIRTYSYSTYKFSAIVTGLACDHQVLWFWTTTFL